MIILAPGPMVGEAVSWSLVGAVLMVIVFYGTILLVTFRLVTRSMRRRREGVTDG